MTSSQRVIPILGLHRCGTSMVARALNLLGVDLGDDLQPPGPDNPRGFWESRYFQSTNMNLLRRLGLHPDGFGSETALLATADGLDQAAIDPALTSTLREHLSSRFGAATVWGWKDPRSSLTYGFWRRVLPELGLGQLRPVVVLRDPEGWYASIRARGDVGAAAEAAGWEEEPYLWSMWVGYHRLLLQVLQEGDAVPVVYEELVDERRRLAALVRLARALELSEAGVAAAAASIVTPAHRAPRPSVPPSVAALHDAIRGRTAPPAPPPAVPRYCVYLPPEDVDRHVLALYDVAQGFHDALVELGHDARLVRRLPGGDVIPIVLGAHRMPHLDLPDNAILVNLEQVDTASPWFTRAYLDLLRTHTVWDPDPGNLEALRALGVQDLRLCRPGHTAGLERFPTIERDIDVIFHGSLNPRRARILEELRARGASVVHLFDMYGPERDAWIARARVVLNVHFYEAAVLEQVRIAPLLANGCFVVSEQSPHPETAPPWRDGVLFAPYEALVDTVMASLDDPELRERQAARGQRLFREFTQRGELERAGIRKRERADEDAIRLSLCMIARDEAHFIHDALASVRGVVDEMVVVDTGSEDDTLAQATALGARVHRVPWTEDFSAARNAALEAATGDWILLLDADERLGPTAAAAIRAVILRDDLDCGLLPLLNAPRLDATVDEVLADPPHEPELLPRLFRRTPDLRWQGVVHENVDDWLASRGHRVHTVPAPIVHYGALPEIREVRGKSVRNSRLLERACTLPDAPVRMLAYLAEEYLGAGRPADARAALDRAWGRLPEELARDPRPTTTWVRVLTRRVAMQLQEYDIDGAEASLAQADRWLRTHPHQALAAHHPNLHHARGQVALARANLSEDRDARWQSLGDAAAWLDAAKAWRDQGSTLPVTPGVTGWRSALPFAHALLQLGDYLGASDESAEVLAHHADPFALLGRAEAWIGLGAFDEALVRLEPLPSTPDRALLMACAHLGCADRDAAAACLAATPSPGVWMAPHRKRLHAGVGAAILAPEAPIVVLGTRDSGAEAIAGVIAAHPAVRRVDAPSPSGPSVRPLVAPDRLLDPSEVVRDHPGARFLHVIGDPWHIVDAALRRAGRSGAEAAREEASAWCDAVHMLRQASAEVLGRTLEVRFDRFEADPETVVRVGRFLGLSLAPTAPHERSEPVLRLSPEERAAVNDEAGHLIAQRGRPPHFDHAPSG